MSGQQQQTRQQLTEQSTERSTKQIIEQWQQKPQHMGLRHIALYVQNFAACVHFYTELLSMRVEWQPDADNIYLTSGCDNLALHRSPDRTTSLLKHKQTDISCTTTSANTPKLDHMGFIVATPEMVHQWHQFLCAHQVKIAKPPKQHRDGATSFYCLDPDDNLVQMLYHPPLVCSDQTGEIWD